MVILLITYMRADGLELAKPPCCMTGREAVSDIMETSTACCIDLWASECMLESQWLDSASLGNAEHV